MGVIALIGFQILLIMAQGGVSWLPVYGVGLLCLGALVMFVAIMPKRTPEGSRLRQHALGLKKFLTGVEKPRLEALARTNPHYFYDILPFAYVLDVSDVWIKKFAGLTVPDPDWYEGSSFSAASFARLADRSLDSCSIKDSGGGSYSGGSGGGSGGGGGGSW